MHGDDGKTSADAAPGDCWFVGWPAEAGFGTAMRRDAVMLRLNRRALLSGVAVITGATVLGMGTGTMVDRIVMRDGWVLRESDLR